MCPPTQTIPWFSDSILAQLSLIYFFVLFGLVDVVVWVGFVVTVFLLLVLFWCIGILFLTKILVGLLVILKSQELRAEKECEFKVSAAQELHITLCLCFRCLLVLGIRISWSVVKPQQFGKVQEIKAWQPPCPLMLHRSNVSTAILGIRDYKLAEENNIVSL